MSWALKVSVPLSNASRVVIVMRSSFGSTRCGRRVARVSGRSLEGRHPGLFSVERPGQLGAALDPELRVRAREVPLDRLEGNVELVRDLAFRAALGRAPYDAELAG